MFTLIMDQLLIGFNTHLHWTLDGMSQALQLETFASVATLAVRNLAGIPNTILSYMYQRIDQPVSLEYPVAMGQLVTHLFPPSDVQSVE